MSSLTEREILRAARTLSRLEPSAQSAARASRILDAATGRSRWRRVILLGSVAAALLIAVAIVAAIFSQTRASAAENLMRIAQINESFKGWVHISGKDSSQTGGINYSTIDYSQANFYADGNAQFIDKVSRRNMFYDRKSNTIYVGNISPTQMAQSFEEAAKRLSLAVSIQGLMNDWKKQENEGELKVKQSHQGGYERYDLQFPGGNQTLWVDPKTKLLAKVHTRFSDHTEGTSYYRYNDPVVREIYDIGVPRDAKIVDNRPAGELKKVLDRLDRKIERGIGDGVAVLTEQIYKNDQSPGQVGKLELYGQSGRQWCWYCFNVGSWKLTELTALASFGPPIDPPPGWPAVADVQSVPRTLHSRIASEAFAWNGHGAQRIDEWSTDVGKLMPRVEDENWLSDEARHYFGFPGRFSFGSYALHFYQPTTSARIIHDDAHRGLLGIDVTADYGADTKAISQLWVDPRRDDVPIEYTCKKAESSGHVYSIETVRYTSWQQTPDHHWYPSRWTKQTKRDYPALKDVLHEKFYLTIDPNARLGEEWFAAPMKHFGEVTVPAEPATSSTRKLSASAPAER